VLCADIGCGARTARVLCADIGCGARTARVLCADIGCGAVHAPHLPFMFVINS